MYITLKAHNLNKSHMHDLFAPFSLFFFRVMEELPEVVENTAARIILNVFEEEGSQNQWAALAPATQRERKRLGYDPEHPILVREGTYRGAFIDHDSPYYVSEVEGGREGSYVQRIGTSNPLFPFHEHGTEHMPARPATPLGDAFIGEMIVEDLNMFLKALIEDMQHG